MINKVLLIDGNNLAFRVHWVNQRLNNRGLPVSLLYGFMKSLIFLKNRYSDYFVVVVWDCCSKRRTRQANTADAKGLIPSGYKENRVKKDDEDLDPMLDSLFQQIAPLKQGLKLCRLMQVQIDDYEADDVIYSYAKDNSAKNIETLIITSDKDYMQILTFDNITIYDGMKNTFWDRNLFIGKYGIDPSNWVDVGALMGDKSDNIHGIKGIGEVTALKLVKEYGNIDNVIVGLKNKQKRNKKEQAILDNTEMLYLAKSLKQMDYINDLPEYRCALKKKDNLLQWFRQYDFRTLYSGALYLTK